MEEVMSDLGGRTGLVPLVQACRLLKLTYQQAYARVLSGRLPAERVDGRWYVRASVVEGLRSDENRGREPDPDGPIN